MQRKFFCNKFITLQIRQALVNLGQRIIGSNTIVQGALPKILKNTPQTYYDGILKTLEVSDVVLKQEKECIFRLPTKFKSDKNLLMFMVLSESRHVCLQKNFKNIWIETHSPRWCHVHDGNKTFCI